MGTSGSGDSPKGATAALAATDLFERLDILSVLLSENADRWLLSPSAATTARILDERSALEEERDTIERELRQRTVAPRGREADGVDDDRHRRADAFDEAAVRYEHEAAIHELAASFFEQRGYTRPAVRHRRRAEALTALAGHDRAEAARLRASRG